MTQRYMRDQFGRIIPSQLEIIYDKVIPRPILCIGNVRPAVLPQRYEYHHCRSMLR